MLFDQEDIERLSPAVRVEVQDYYVRKHFADRHVASPERRLPKGAELPREQPADTGGPEVVEVVAPRRAWPRVWQRNDSSRMKF
jgi:hypothetical protein